MAVNEQYFDELGIEFNLTRDSEGFWISIANPQPTYFNTSFRDSEFLNDGLTLSLPYGDIGDWFQVDEIRVYTTSDTTDSYAITVKDFNDVAGGNPQVYREVSTFPNILESTLVPINEFITDTSFNSIMGKLYENYEFLIDKSKMLSVPPNGVLFRYGYSSFYGHGFTEAWNQMDNGQSQMWEYDPKMNIKHTTANSSTMVYSTSGDEVLYAVPTLSGADPDVTSRDFYIFGDDVFVDIKSLEVDSNGRIWVLDDTGDRGKVGIFEYGDNWSAHSTWDVSTEGHPKHITTPTDLKIRDGQVYIACDKVGGGVEIRIFTEAGSFLGSISNQALTSIESIAVTSDTIVSLSDNILYIFDLEFNLSKIVDLKDLITKYDYESKTYLDSTITKLSNNANDIFFYGIAGNLIYKFNKNGNIVESFGETVVNHMNSLSGGDYEKPISDAYHDVNFNLYVSSEYDVIKYYDRAEVSDRLLNDLSFNLGSNIWTLDDINVDSNENTASWVYNRVFDRILDDLNMFRLALKGPQVLIETNTFEKTTVDNFKPTEYVRLPYEKGDIAIGVNELHCEGAINRCIHQLQECFDTCLEYLNLKKRSIDPNSLEIYTFELKQPFVIPIDGDYYFDVGREIDDFTFEWVDSIAYRGDPKLKAYMQEPVGPQELLNSTVLAPTDFDSALVYDGLDGQVPVVKTWTLTEIYGGVLSEDKSVNVVWNTRLYVGILPLGTSVGDLEIGGGDIISDVDNMKWSSLNPTIDGTVSINISSGAKWYVAVPASEWGSSISIYHPDYPEMEYDFFDDNRHTIEDIDLGNGSMAGMDYYIFTPNLTDPDPIYSSGVGEILFRIVRTP